jgi:1A family penicillin-binding protein
LLRVGLPIVGGIIALGILGVIALFAWYSRDLPDPNGIVNRTVAQTTKIFARDGSTLLYEVHGEERRTVVELDAIPEFMKWATIDIEDKDFYRHGGVDLRGIFRAVVTNIIRLDVHGQGGSTITQQFIKNAILSGEKSYTRKIKEAVLAYQIEKRFTKDQILKLYFNEIPYGRNAYGVEAAAQSYFGKSAKDLKLDEAALLAALPQAPSYYSPDGNHTDALIARQATVLDRMVEQGHATREAADEAKVVDTLSKVVERREAIQAPHFVIYVKELLAEKYGEKLIEQGGLRVTTTLEPTLQDIAEGAVREGMEKVERYGGSNAALVALNPHTGQILAMVGSRDYFDEAHDGNVNVVLRPRQPGSSFKPIVYTQAFREGYTPETMLFDLKTNFGGSPAYVPNNYDGSEHGPVSMRQALAGSLNIPAVKTLYLAGLDDVLDLAHQLGYSTLNDKDRYGLSLTLGGGEVKLLDHAGAFGVFANEGVRKPSIAILKVEDHSGKTLEEAKEDGGERVLDENIARLTSSVLSDNGARAYIFGQRNFLTLGNRPVAAKTGTTNDFRDAWTMGYTSDLVAGVWTGNNDNSEMSRGADGSVIAAPIWHTFMERATQGAPIVSFRAPKPNDAEKPILQGRLASGEKIHVDKVTGKEIPDSCLKDYPEKFVDERELEAIHDILFFVDKNNPRGPQPSRPESDPQYERWEGPVRAWAEKNGKLTSRPAKEDCDLRSAKNDPKVSFTEPDDGASVDGGSFVARVNATTKRSIQSVTFFLDEEEVKKVTSSPYKATINLSGVSAGFHSLKAVATDSVEQTGSSTININVRGSGSGTTLYFTEPAPRSTWTLGSSALTLRVVASDPDGVQSVTFFLARSGGAVTELAASGSGTYSATWTPKELGVYSVTAVLTDKKKNTTSSDAVAVEVTE